MIKCVNVKALRWCNSPEEEAKNEGSDPETRFSPTHGPICVGGVPNDSVYLARNQAQGCHVGLGPCCACGCA